MFVPAFLFWFVEALPAGAETDARWFASLGVGGAIAALILVLWRLDRAAWDMRFQESVKREHELATSFRAIVQENTAANTRLADLLSLVLAGQANQASLAAAQRK